MKDIRQELDQIAESAGLEAASALSLLLEEIEMYAQHGTDRLRFHAETSETRNRRRAPAGSVFVNHRLACKSKPDKILYRHKLVMSAPAYHAYLEMRKLVADTAAGQDDYATIAEWIGERLVVAASRRIPASADDPARVDEINRKLTRAFEQDFGLAAR